MNFSDEPDCELCLTDHDQARLSVAGRDYSGRPALDEALRHRLRKAALDPTQYGTLLFEALLPSGDDLLAGYLEGLAIARHEKKRLRLRLHIEPAAPPELHHLHWELLYDPKRKLALGRSRDTAFSRYLSVPLAPGTAVVERPKLLVAIAAPQDLAQYGLPIIDRDQMQESIARALSPLAGRVDCELLDGPATAGRLRDRLVGGGFHIIHLQAHGLVDPDGAVARLVLEDGDRGAAFIDEDLVAEIIEGGGDLRLVTLIACHGGAQPATDPFSGLGPALVRRGIPAVVAMRRAIGVDDAALFSEHLYLNLARCGRIDTAVNEARLQLYLAGPNLVQWGTPAVFMRLREGLLWRAEESRLPGRDRRPGHLTDPSRTAREIAEVLSKGEAVLVLGPAVPLGGMEGEGRTAEEVIAAHLADQLSLPPAGRALAEVARELEMEIGREAMLEHLRAAVRDPRTAPREIFRRLARLPFPVIVATGYDAFLEEELSHAERPVDRVLNGWKVPAESAEDGLVIRLFGGLDEESSVVVTEDDRWEFFRSFHSLADRVKSWFATRSLVFVGLDPDADGFRHLFSEIERFRARRTRAWYLLTTAASRNAGRWAERKGVGLIEADPGRFLALVEEALTEVRAEGEQPAAPGSAKLPSRPYKFLNYFETDDAAIFFGRREETSKLASKIHAYPLNLLYAPSGCGKTSLIHAGLVPALRQAGYRPLYARVYDDPEGEIRRAARAAVPEESGAAAGMPLEELLPRLASSLGQPLVVFVDQFEEIFIRYDRQVRDRFAATLRRCLDAGRGQVRFVLSLREDFLARLSEFRDPLPTIFHNEVRLVPLDEERSREAIVEPAKLLGLEVEPQLVDRLIDDLAAEGIDPPQLQIVCDTLYDALAPGERRLTVKAYRRLGETRRILGGYLERVLRELPPGERQPTRQILKGLVTSEETKSLCRIADLVRIAGCGEEEVARILAELANRRLIRRVPHEEGFWYELTHEYLVDEISRWLSERDRELKKIRELLEQAVRNYRHLGMTMTPAQVRLVRANEDDLQLSKEERALLRESEQARRTRRRIAALAVATAAILLAVTGVALRYWHLATHVFLQSEDREVFIPGRLFQPPNYRFEGIRVFTGSPARWTLDRWLGFPRLEYHTDFDLSQIHPDYRDSLKAGRAYLHDIPVRDEILKMLRPEEKIAYLVVEKRSSVSIQELTAIYKQPASETERVRDLISLLGWSGVQDVPIIEMTIDYILDQDRTAPFVFISLANHSALFSMLRNLPAKKTRQYLDSFLERPSSRNGALFMLGYLGDRTDVNDVAPHLSSDDREIFMTAAQTLNNLEDCTQLSEVRRVIFDPHLDPLRGTPATEYLSRCGDTLDLESLAAMIEQIAVHIDSRGNLRSGILGAMSMIVQRQEDPVREKRFLALLKRQLQTSHPYVRMQSAGLLAKWGEPDGLTMAAEVLLGEELDSTQRYSTLVPFNYFRSIRLNDFLIRALQIIPERAISVGNLYLALCRYDDDKTLLTLVNGLGSDYPVVRIAAQRSLITMGSERVMGRLREASESDDPIASIYAMRALSILENRPHLEFFKEFIENRAQVETDLHLIEQAILGLQAAYCAEPASAAIGALNHRLHEVRLAAMTALLGHDDRRAVRQELEKLAETQVPRLHATAAITLWALDLVEGIEASMDSARDALAAGDPQQAARILNIVSGPSTYGFISALRKVLSPRFAKSDSGLSLFRHRAVELLLLQARVEIALGRSSSAIEFLGSAVAFHPELRKEIVDDPNFEPLQRFYAFRVEMGLEPPKTVGGLDLPKPQAAVPKDQGDSGPAPADSEPPD